MWIDLRGMSGFKGDGWLSKGRWVAKERGMGGSRKKPFFRENWVYKFGSSRCLTFTTCKMVVCLEKLLELFASLSAPCTIFFSFVVFSLQDLFVKFYRGVQSVLNVSFVLCYVPGGGDLLKDI